MNHEIERKFLISQIPDLKNITPISYERYFLETNDETEIRIQKKWTLYEYETKTNESVLSAVKTKETISQEKFNKLKEGITKYLNRKSYLISNNPEISIKIYSWYFKWLSRVEVEFKDEIEARNFKIPDWFWKEITDSSLWRDSKLIKLSHKDFQELISS